MTCSPLAIARRHVLGDLYSRCDAIESVPVYLESTDGESLGFVDQSLGLYVDAFLFHLSEDICKKLSAGQFTFSFNYDYSANEEKVGNKRRISLSSMTLVPRPAYAKPLPRNAAALAAKAEAESAALAAAK